MRDNKKQTDTTQNNTASSVVVNSVTSSTTAQTASIYQEKTTPQVEKQYSFTVHQYPSSARVRIMNINPKYRDGIKLVEGSYDIIVDKKGYVTKRKTIYVNKNYVVSISLVKKPESRATKNTFYDKRTNLVWQDNKNSRTLTKSWSSAKKYCSNLVLGERSNWRLPSRKDLNTLFYTRKRLRNNGNKPYWTSSANSSVTAWYIDFDDGYNGIAKKNQYGYIRCVRY